MSDEEITEEGAATGVSRRTVLKTIGVGTAVAWAAPMIKSIPAFAAGGSVAPCGPCRALNCANEGHVCGQDRFNGQSCICVSRAEDGKCNCYNNGGYCAANANICATDADCVSQFGAGYQCYRLVPGCNDCGSATTYCGAACNSGQGKGLGKSLGSHRGPQAL